MPGAEPRTRAAQALSTHGSTRPRDPSTLLRALLVAAATLYLAYRLDEPAALLMVTVAYTHRLVSAMTGGVLEWRSALRALRAPGEPPPSGGIP